MSAAPQEDISELMDRARSGEEITGERLFPLVYDELRAMASRQLAGERAGHSMSTTVLVHEAYLKLAAGDALPVRTRGYFFGAAARAMRQILVDHARRANAAKRGGGAAAVTLQEQHLVHDVFAGDLLELHDALERLAAIDGRAARVVECRFFGGLDTEETAAALGVSPRTVKRDWMVARAWLYRALGETSEPGDDRA